MTLHVPAGILAVLTETAGVAAVDLAVVLAVALDHFGRLDAPTRRGLIGLFVATATGPRLAVPVPATLLSDYGRWCGKTAANAANAALWVFARLPETERLGLLRRCAA